MNLAAQCPTGPALYNPETFVSSILPCNGNGTCDINGNCACNPGHQGSDCAYPLGDPVEVFNFQNSTIWITPGSIANVSVLVSSTNTKVELRISPVNPGFFSSNPQIHLYARIKSNTSSLFSEKLIYLPCRAHGFRFPTHSISARKRVPFCYEIFLLLINSQPDVRYHRPT